MEKVESVKDTTELLEVPVVDFNLNDEEVLYNPELSDRATQSVADIHSREARVLEFMYSSKQKYTPVQKMQAVAAFVLTGSPAKAARLSGVDSGSIRYWKAKAPWWSMAVTEARKRKQDQFDGIMTGLLDKTLGELADRLVRGDPLVNKATGKMRRQKLSARDLIAVWNTLFEKRALMRGDPTSSVEKNSFDTDMKKLAETLTKLSTGVIERELKDNVATTN